MMRVEVMVGEMHVVEFDQMQRADQSIVRAGFMHELMGNHELCSVVVGRYKSKSEDKRNVFKGEFHGREHGENLEKYSPGKYHRCI
jgi:hypothetical protein